MCEHCDNDPCIYDDDVQEGAMWALIAKQVEDGYFEEGE